MALIGTDQQDDEEIKANSAMPGIQSSEGSGGLAGGTGSGSGQGATTSAGTSGGTGGAAPSAPGGYTNLSQYLTANQDTGSTTGQAAANVVQQSADKATSAQNQYNTNATNDITNASSGLGINSDVMGRINSGAPTIDQTKLDLINQGGNSTTGYTGPSNIAAQYSGPQYGNVQVSYGGPTNVGGFTGQTASDQTAALGAQNDVSQKASAASSGMPGVSSLLSNAYNQPNYSRGENNLDAFLAGGTQGGQKALGAVTGLGTAASNNYANINNALQGQISNAQQQASTTNSAYQNAINKAQQAAQATQNAYNLAIKDAQDKASSTQQTAAAKQASYHSPIRDQKTQSGWDAPYSTLKQNVTSGAKDLQTAPNRIVGTPAEALHAAYGDQNSLNNMATDVLTGGANVLMPTATGAVTKAGKDIVNQIGSHFKLAHGGEVPKYSKLLKALRK